MPHLNRAASFNAVAKQYDKLRPGYPSSFIREIIREVGVPAAKIKAFEIGCGTGKATADFAKVLLGQGTGIGLRIKAIDPGAELLEIAKSNLSRVADSEPEIEAIVSQSDTAQPIQFINSRAEDYQVAPEEEHSYDLVYAAQAFHYVDQQKGLECATGYLNPTDY